MNRHAIVLCTALLGLLVGERVASAASGVVRGTFKFYQNQGNYCPTSRNCTGAKYVQSQFQTFQPVSEIKVFVQNSAGGAIIGQGSTGTDGTFTVAWTSSTNVSSADIFLRTEHKDNRFRLLRINDSSQFQIVGPDNIALTNNTTASSPQQVGTWHIGSSTSPNIHFNVWDGAYRTWKDSLALSNRLVNSFTDIKILLFTTAANDCPTSCAQFGINTIRLDQNAMFRPQGRIMHELGHLAGNKVDAHMTVTNYNFNNNPGWSLNTQEFRADSWEEGLATFIGDVALYGANAPEPYTCLGAPSSPCPASGFDIETATCVTGQDRWPLTIVRMLRDYFDTVNEDPAGTGADVTSATFGQMMDVFESYPECFTDHCDNEPFASNGTVDDNDGRSGVDWEFNFDAEMGVETSAIRALNCNVQ